MKDIQKIKEFFSQPMKESLTGGYPHTKTSGENFEKITITEPIDDATKNKMIQNFRDKGWDAKPNNGGGITAIKKAMMEAKKETAVDMAKKQLDALGVKYELGNEFKPFKVIYKPTGQSDEFYDTFEDIVDLFNLKGVVKSTINEAKEEDKVVTITMDIPLFIRMLEYSREDAAEDMDLHDITEKAISLNKEKDILSMEDYDAIVGSAEEIEEGFYGKGDKRRGLQNQSKLSSAEYQMAKKLKSFKASDWKWNADEDLYIKVVNETSDYMKRRQAQNDYAVNKKDKPAKSYNPKPSGKTDYMKRREKELAEAILAKLKK